MAENSPNLVKDKPTDKKLNKFYTGKPKEIMSGHIITEHLKAKEKEKELKTAKMDGILPIGNTILDWSGFLI